MQRAWNRVAKILFGDVTNRLLNRQAVSTSDAGRDAAERRKAR
jgi:hypothetical protein